MYETTYNERTIYAVVAVRMPELFAFTDKDEKTLHNYYLSSLNQYFGETAKYTGIPSLVVTESLNDVPAQQIAGMAYRPPPREWIVGFINDDDFHEIEKLITGDLLGGIVASGGGFSIEDIRNANKKGFDGSALNVLLHFDISRTLSYDDQMSLFISHFSQTVLNLIGQRYEPFNLN